MSVPLQTVPDNQDREDRSREDESVSQAKHEAAEIIARARKHAEAIVAEARSGASTPASPLAALGDNAEEIITQVRKLIKRQRELQAERDRMATDIEALQSERDELVHRLTDAVERMEELAALAHASQTTPTQLPPAAPPRPATPPPPPTPEPPPRPQLATAPVQQEDTSLAARLKKAEATEEEDTSLAARLKKAEKAEDDNYRAARVEENEKKIAAAVTAERTSSQPAVRKDDDDTNDSARSFYDRHSANLPRLEGDGGHSVLSAMGGMRPELETKGRRGRRGRRDRKK